MWRVKCECCLWVSLKNYPKHKKNKRHAYFLNKVIRHNIYNKIEITGHMTLNI